MTALADLASDLGVDDGDVTVMLAALAEAEPDLTGGDLPGEVSGEAVSFVRTLLDPHGERTTPELYRPGADPHTPRMFGLGGPDPTAPPDADPR
jgi:hypothetical protein